MGELCPQRLCGSAKTLWTYLLSALLEIWYFVHCLLDHAIDRIFGLIYDSHRVHIPGTSDAILLDSATGLADKIRKQQLKAEAVVSAYIDRIKNVNGILNAVVSERFDEALEEAKQLDRDIAEGKITERDFEQKPFLGIPFTTKESTACKGLYNSLGLLSRKGYRAEEDADVVVLMKKAGAIVLAVTNIPQLILWQESVNPVYGITNNPYNTTRTVGASSGGEASIVAACGSPIGIGTDLGGSIRIPSFSCGIFGHKTSSGITPTKGLYFRTGDEGDTMVTIGPMARSASDLAPIVKVIAGDNVHKLSLDKPVDIKKVKVYYMEEKRHPLVSTLRSEIKESYKKVVSYFRDVLLEEPQKVDYEGVQYGAELWRHWLKYEPDSNYRKDLTNREREINTWEEIFRYFTGRSDYNLALVLNLLQEFAPAVNAEWAEQLTKSLRQQIIKKLGEDGVLLYPSAPWPASYHSSAYLRPFNFSYYAIWNVLNLPVTQVPLGLSKEGLPLGIQVIAAPYQDHLCIAVAKELEKGFGGYVPPFPVGK